MTYRSDRRGETPEKPWPLEAVYPVGTPRANFIMARNSNVPFERPKIRMQSICHSTRKSNIRMLKRIFGKRIWDSCAYLTGGVQIGLLTAAEPLVAGMAARSAATLGKLDLVDKIIPMVTIPALRKDIKAALCAFGPPVAERLGAILADGRADAALRREMPWVLARIGGASSARLLVASLGAEDRTLRHRVVKALNHMHNSDPSLPQPSPAIAEQIHRETRHYYEALVVCRALDGQPRRTVGARPP